MILMPDLFSFAYVPNWYSQLDMLAEMALPEPWRFKNPIYLTKNPDTPICLLYTSSVEVEYITDMQKVMEYGVMSMPALVVNEKVVAMGKVLKAADVVALLHKLGF